MTALRIVLAVMGRAASGLLLLAFAIEAATVLGVTVTMIGAGWRLRKGGY